VTPEWFAAQTALSVDFHRSGRIFLARLGAYEYPEIGLFEAISIGKRISQDFGGSISRAHLAEVLGMSERGGRFSVVLGGLRMWRIAEGRGNIRVTQLGLRSASPVSSHESAETTAELARSVDLFNELQARLGTSFSDSAALILVLEELTGESRMEVSQRISTIEKALKELPAGAAASLERSLSNPDPATSESKPSPESPSPELGRLKLSFSGGTVDLEESPAAIAMVIQLLEDRRRRQ
jgi:hypothetical protein